MKTIIQVFPLLIAAATLARSQETPTSNSPDSAALVSSPPTTTRILGTIPDGTPPPPASPRPEYIVPAKDVLNSSTLEQGGRTITIQQIKPIALPPLPAPVEPMVSDSAPEFIQRLSEYRDAHPRSGILFLGATVFRSKDSLPRTLVHYWPEGKGEQITFWSSADFALIAGGINSFVDSAADSHCLLLGWGNVDIDRMSELQAAKGREYDAPAIPDFPEGNASFQITGKQPAAVDLVPIQALHDIYNSELARLRTAYEGREQARLAHEAELKAHPPLPKDITLNYWRTEKPVSAKKGGAAR